MIMNNFRGMPCVRALLMALVVVFVFGAVVPGGAWARVEMQNGHEGDPTDTHDVVGGGSGFYGGSEDQVITGKSENIFTLDNCCEDFRFIENGIVLTAFFDGQQLFFVFVSDEVIWRQK